MPQRKDKDGIYKRKDSRYWWASFTDAGGRRTRQSTGTSDRREAEALLSKWRLEAHLSNKWDKEPERTFDELMVQYLEMVSVHKRDKGRRDRDSVKRLMPYFTHKELSTLKAVNVIGYIAQRREAGAADGTINKELGALSAALNWARRNLGWNVPNEVQGRKPKEPPGRIRWITHEEADKLIEAAHQSSSVHLIDFITLALHTGMRKNEMLKLEWTRVDLKAGLVYLQSMDQKSGRFGSVPLNETARSVLIRRARFRAEHCPDSPWVFC